MDLSKFIAYFGKLKLKNSTTPNPVPGAPIEGADNLGAYLKDFAQSVQKQVTNIEQQTNSNANGQPEAPPAIQGFRMSNGPSGEIQFEITDNSEIKRGINYSVDVDPNPAFPNPHTIELGQARNGHVNLPGQTLHGRATSWYAAGNTSGHVYHGSQVAPLPVTGGVIGPRSAGMGSGTGAPGTGGGPGPVPARTPTSGYNWTSQRTAPQPGFATPTPTPAQLGAQATTSSSIPTPGGLVILPLIDVYGNWTLAKYNPNNYPPGTTFVISNWNVTYIVKIVAGAKTWVYYSGIYEAAYASLPTKGFNAAPLGVNDTGLKFYDDVTYIRTWKWTGIAWMYASGELPGGDTSPAIMMLAGNTVPPGWASCINGSVTITTAQAGTVSFATPNFNAGYYPKGGGYTGVPVAVLNPTINQITPAGTVDISGVTGTLTGSVPAASGTGASIPTGVSIGGTATFSGAPVTPTINASGEPEHIAIPFYVKL